MSCTSCGGKMLEKIKNSVTDIVDDVKESIVDTVDSVINGDHVCNEETCPGGICPETGEPCPGKEVAESTEA